MTEDPRPVLVVDFGAQYAQLIARRVRECNVYSEIVPHDMPVGRARGARPAGLILSGGPASRLRARRARAGPRLPRAGRPGPRHLLRAAGHGPGARRRGRPTRRPRVRQDRPRGHAPAASCSQELRAEQTVWMSHGDAVVAAARGLPGHRDDRRHAGRGHGGPRAGPVRRAVPSRGRAHPAGAGRPEAVPLRGLRAAARLDPDHRSSSAPSSRSAPRSARTRRSCARCPAASTPPSRPLLVHRAVGDQLQCVFVDNGLLRDGEAEQVEETFRGHFRDRPGPREGRGPVPEPARRRHRPRGKRKRIGEEFIRVFEEVAASRREAQVPGPGHPRIPTSSSPASRDRRQDQEPPQRGRAARATWTSSSSSRCGTCSRTRSAGSARSSACPRRSCGASRSPARGWPCASSARSPASGWTSSGRAERSSRRRSAGRACSASCGRRLPCSRRSAASA